nr:HEAT repeat domain-containing protein [Planctomycetota bacterium]
MANDNPQRPPIVTAVNRTKFRAILFSIAMCAGVGAGVFLASRAVIDTWNVRQIEKLKLRLVAEGDLSLAEQIKLRGGDPTECYVRLLMHSDAEVRRDAVWALGAPPISDRAARELLMTLTDEKQLEAIKAEVLFQLGKIGQVRSGPLTTLESEFLAQTEELLGCTDSTVRRSAVDALNRFG